MESRDEIEKLNRASALTGLEAALHLVDHVDPALAADQTVVAVATAQRLQRVTDLHGTNPGCLERPCGGRLEGLPESGNMGLIPPAASRPGCAVSKPSHGRMSINHPELPQFASSTD